MIGRHSIRKQVGGRGLYGKIEIYVESSIDQEIIFEQHVHKWEDYQTAIRFGLNFGLEQLKQLNIFSGHLFNSCFKL